jgi:hypothetical protein
MPGVTRREVLRDLAVTTAALSAAGVTWPSLAQDEEVIPFTDLSAAAPGAPPPRRPPSLQTFYTPNDEFFAIQHYAVPPLDAAAHRLRVGGLMRTHSSCRWTSCGNVPAWSTSLDSNAPGTTTPARILSSATPDGPAPLSSACCEPKA